MGNEGVDHTKRIVFVLLVLISDVVGDINDLNHCSLWIVRIIEGWDFDLVVIHFLLSKYSVNVLVPLGFESWDNIFQAHALPDEAFLLVQDVLVTSSDVISTFLENL